PWHWAHACPTVAACALASSHFPAAIAACTASTSLRAFCAQSVGSAFFGFQNASVSVNAFCSTAAFLAAVSAFDASTAGRTAANAGPTCRITFWYASSSAFSGGGSRLARSKNLLLITEGASNAGRQL